jgi:predicted DCC family thiol-disulfide oxidoreductase YuxK
MPASFDATDSYLLYDGECPACRAYVAMSRLRQKYPALAVWNAREQPDKVAAWRAKGFDVNEGMILVLDGRIHFGAEATRMIALIGGAESLPAQGFLWTVGLAPWARALYPLLNRGRQLLLWLKRVPLIP